MIEFRNPYSDVFPPGSIVQILSHPVKEKAMVELAVFQSHRYAFFFWNQWTNQLKQSNPPCLVTLDWHQDLLYPCELEKEWLSNLNQKSDIDVAIFSWTKLAENNDGHILSAAYLNLIGNIYVHCRQGTHESQWRDEELIDIQGNKHIVKKFKTLEDLGRHLLLTDEHNVYFDIDLDFFTHKNPYNGVGEKFTYVKKLDINKFLSFDTPLIKWIFERLCGFTIATEPEHCGGLIKANELLATLDTLYFKPMLFTDKCDWKHKCHILK